MLDTDKEIERIKTVEGALHFGAAVAVDAITHSIPGLNVLFALLAEPTGAAAGVACEWLLVYNNQWVRLAGSTWQQICQVYSSRTACIDGPSSTSQTTMRHLHSNCCQRQQCWYRLHNSASDIVPFVYDIASCLAVHDCPFAHAVQT